MARLEEWKPTVCEEADGNAGLDRLQLASKRHLQRVSKSGLLKKFLVEEQNTISILDFSCRAGTPEGRHVHLVVLIQNV